MMRKILSRNVFVLVFTLVVFGLIPISSCKSVKVNKSESKWKFIVYGDTRTDEERHKVVLSSMVKNTPDYEFIVNVGDVAQKGSDTAHWNMWERAVTEVLGSTGQSGGKRYYVAPGNHEAILKGGLENWKTYLHGQCADYKSTDGLYYTFDHKNLRIIVLDCLGDIAKQKEMVVEAAQSNPHPWLFAVWHEPIFVFGNKSYQEALHKEFGTVLYDNGCDMIFVGHSHMYVRTKKLKLNGEKHPPIDEENGTVQLLTGNGGVKMSHLPPMIDDDGNGYMIPENAYITDSLQHGYTELEIIGDEKMIMKHILHDGSLFDSEVYTPNKKSKKSTNREF